MGFQKLKLEELNRLSVEEFRKTPKLPVCLLLDNIRSLHNVGSAFRTADAFGFEKIILTGITGTPPHREIEKAALGATESVTWEYIENSGHAASALKNAGYKIVAIEQAVGSTPLNKFGNFKDKVCLVFGNEINGVSEEIMALADTVIEIPQSGTKHSLNISVCVGIVGWEFYKNSAQS